MFVSKRENTWGSEQPTVLCTIERVEVVQKVLMRMNEREVKVQRSQQDLLGSHHFIAQVPVLLK